MEELLRFEKVSFAYEEGREDQPALTDCTVTVNAGERIAVLGANGAGKSTFFLLANGVLRPRQGTIYFQGQAVGQRELKALRRGVGLVFQDPDVQILGGTVEEEISFGPMNLGLSRQEVAGRVEAAMEQLGLTHLRRRAPQYLSGGEKKQVSIADALAMEPRLLLLDEPASSLDPLHRKVLEGTLAELEQRGIALMVSTHDVDFAWRWACRALVFRGGRLEADRAPEEVFRDTALLERCGLEQPALFRAGMALGLRPLPRTMEEFETAAARMRGKDGENREEWV